MAVKKKAAKRPAKKKAARRAVKSTLGKRVKGLEGLVVKALHDRAFIKLLEKDPERALREQGFPTDPELVEAIKQIDFDVFRKSFGKLSILYC